MVSNISPNVQCVRVGKFLNQQFVQLMSCYEIGEHSRACRRCYPINVKR